MGMFSGGVPLKDMGTLPSFVLEKFEEDAFGFIIDHKTVWLPGKSPNEANLIDFTNEAVERVPEESGEAQLSFLTDSLIATIDSLEKETERFRELLLYGRKKDALESAMKHGLWGHALLLASKMDSRTHARIRQQSPDKRPAADRLPADVW
ncbi:Protein transport protein Sec16A, partial [Ophiophagus hannah]